MERTNSYMADRYVRQLQQMGEDLGSVTRFVAGVLLQKSSSVPLTINLRGRGILVGEFEAFPGGHPELEEIRLFKSCIEIKVGTIEGFEPMEGNINLSLHDKIEILRILETELYNLKRKENEAP